MKYLTTSLLFTLLLNVAPAQDFPKKEINLQELADNFGFAEAGIDNEEAFENLTQLLAHPLNVNSATADDLRLLKLLTEEQILQLLNHRSVFGPLVSVYELQAIQGFDRPLLYRLMPFVVVNDPEAAVNQTLWKRVKTEGEHYALMRYERTLESRQGQREPNSANRFKGSPDRLYLRLRSGRAGDYSAGFTGEKDAGESFAFKPGKKQYGFDYTSFHVQVQNKGRIRNLIVGDYQSQFGHGLMIGGLFGIGKGSETITTARGANVGFLPYTSVYETGQLRGIATTIALSKTISISASFSHAPRDTKTDTLENEEELIIASFQNTGYHRNELELKTRKKSTERNYAAILQYKKQQLDAGLMINSIVFDGAVQHSPTPYNQFAFNDRSNLNAGLYLNYNFQNIAFFSEASHTIGHGSAFVAGMLWNVAKPLDIALLHRNYETDFYSFYSNAFSESSMPQNETGTYWGIRYTVNRRISIASYLDLFRFPWLRFRTYAPSQGHEWLLRFNYQPTRKIILFAQMREESKQRNVDVDSAKMYVLSEGIKHNYILSLDCTASPHLRLKTRAQFSTYNIAHKTSRGIVLLQDINVHVNRIEVTARYALFDTDNYDNRQYVYENDIWLAYSMPAYYGKGIRRCLLFEYTINRYVTLWLRYTNTRYLATESIGSGMDRITGNQRNDVKVQTRIKF